ncbi:MAG TPA: CoA transferase [Dehalococcoidia bacterium]|nr:CoA transferase [Dehalococcoidia bacterium]
MPALDGMRILDMTQYEAGTSCTQALAWLGADVVKVEPPLYGDPGRRTRQGDGNSPYFLNWNSNKRSIVLDLSQQRGRELLLEMAPHYDVFVENYGPGVVEKLDIGYDVMSAANPGIIYARLKGFGTSGPYADYKCYDMVAQAAAGAFSVTGEADGTPMRPGPTIADSGTGMQLALAITAAYVQKQRTGEGQVIEISMQEAMTYYMRTRVANGADWGESVTERSGNGPAAFVNLYPCKGGGPNDYAYIMCSTSRMWDMLCVTIGRPELANDPRYTSGEHRTGSPEELREIVTGWTMQRTKWEVMEILGKAGVPCSANFDTHDLFHDPHLNERDFIHTIDHPTQGEIKLLGWAPRLSKSDVPIERGPLMGEHSDEVLRGDLQVSDEQVAELREQGVVA